MPMRARHKRRRSGGAMRALLAAALVILAVLPFTAPFASVDTDGQVGQTAARLQPHPHPSADAGTIARRQTLLTESGRTRFVALSGTWMALADRTVVAGGVDDTDIPADTPDGRSRPLPLRI